MSKLTITVVTQRTFSDDAHILMQPGFVFLNMGKDHGIWWIDKQHPEYPQALDLAIETARLFGAKETLEEYEALKAELEEQEGDSGLIDQLRSGEVSIFFDKANGDTVADLNRVLQHTWPGSQEARNGAFKYYLKNDDADHKNYPWTPWPHQIEPCPNRPLSEFLLAVNKIKEGDKQ